MRTETEIQDRLDGCQMELDGHLHPQSGINPYRAAVLQGWVFALNWVIENENPRDRTEDIKEHLDYE